MLGMLIQTNKTASSGTVQTACLDGHVHVTFKGEAMTVAQRERLICFTSCDCREPGSGDLVEFSGQAENLLLGYLHPAPNSR